MPAEVLSCTPSTLLKKFPCLACLSKKELKAVIVDALATQKGLTITQVLSNSDCFMCLSKKQRLQILAALFGNAYLTNKTVPQIASDIKCLVCGPDTQIEAALIYLMCRYIQGT